MHPPETDETQVETRVETLTAALVYLMTRYARTGCPGLALCVSRHMQCLACHPQAPDVLRDICASLHGAWQHAAASVPAKGSLH